MIKVQAIQYIALIPIIGYSQLILAFFWEGCKKETDGVALSATLPEYRLIKLKIIQRLNSYRIHI